MNNENLINEISSLLIHIADEVDMNKLFDILENQIDCYYSGRYSPLICKSCKKQDTCSDECEYSKYSPEDEIADFVTEQTK